MLGPPSSLSPLLLSLASSNTLLLTDSQETCSGPICTLNGMKTQLEIQRCLLSIASLIRHGSARLLRLTHFTLSQNCPDKSTEVTEAEFKTDVFPLATKLHSCTCNLSHTTFVLRSFASLQHHPSGLAPQIRPAHLCVALKACVCFHLAPRVNVNPLGKQTHSKQYWNSPRLVFCFTPSPSLCVNS